MPLLPRRLSSVVNTHTLLGEPTGAIPWRKRFKTHGPEGIYLHHADELVHWVRSHGEPTNPLTEALSPLSAADLARLRRRPEGRILGGVRHASPVQVSAQTTEHLVSLFEALAKDKNRDRGNPTASAALNRFAMVLDNLSELERTLLYRRGLGTFFAAFETIYTVTYLDVDAHGHVHVKIWVEYGDCVYEINRLLSVVISELAVNHEATLSFEQLRRLDEAEVENAAGLRLPWKMRAPTPTAYDEFRAAWQQMCTEAKANLGVAVGFSAALRRRCKKAFRKKSPAVSQQALG